MSALGVLMRLTLSIFLFMLCLEAGKRRRGVRQDGQMLSIPLLPTVFMFISSRTSAPQLLFSDGLTD